MSTAPDPAAVLETVNLTIERLQRSARRTIPMFMIGILATIVAAGVAVYYIVTLSADLHDARRKLDQSQIALSETQGKLATLNDSLRQAQQHVSSPQAAQSVETAISNVNRSQQSLTAVASSLNAANTNITPTGSGSTGPTCQLEVNGVSYVNGSCEVQISTGGSFQIWTVGRSGPSASVVRQGPMAFGSWEAVPGEASVDLGQLQRRGACWVNENGRICAWK